MEISSSTDRLLLQREHAPRSGHRLRPRALGRIVIGPCRFGEMLEWCGERDLCLEPGRRGSEAQFARRITVVLRTVQLVPV
jgi:hypothetical protein